MNKLENNLLEDIEAVALIVGCVIGIDILSLPSQVAVQVKQNGWISVILGSIYPISLGMMLIYFCKKHPNENILLLSKKYFGFILGNILNILFMLGFAFYIISTSLFFANIFRVYATDFLSPIKIIIVTIFIGAYISYNSVKAIGRINKISLYLLVILVIMLSFAFIRGKYLNMFPILNVNYLNIIKASSKSFYAYAGLETAFIIYPFFKNKTKIQYIVFKSLIIIISMYTFITFITIYYLGYKCTTKLLWPVIMVTESINLSFTNSFRLVFLFLWSIIVLKLLVNQFFSLVYILKDTLNLKNTLKLNMILCSILIIISLPITKSYIKIRVLLYNVNFKVITFNVFYITIIFIMIIMENIRKRLKVKIK